MRAAVALALLLVPAAALAQTPRVVVTGSLAAAEHRVEDRGVGGGVEISAGTLFGSGVRVSVGSRGTIAVSGRTGVLHPKRGATLPRDVAELGLDGALMMHPWFDVIAGVRVRSYTTMLARQRWTMPYLGAAARVPFAVQGLRGLLDITVHPFAGVSGLTRPEVAISTGAGVAYARGRLDVQLGYALERYDFARGTVDERFEQLSALTLQVQVRALGRPVP
ncbi:MAG TPA: hypothetical protein VK467_09480 [Gemmatimonadales bacterium]|nr:hypothetical protein [Gemmatimonadales bacterium]